jgi:hypothetical protein
VGSTAPADRDGDALYRRPAAAPQAEPSFPGAAAASAPPFADAPALPSIADYWPDLPQRMGPPADYFTASEPPRVVTAPPPPPFQHPTAEIPVAAPPRRGRALLTVAAAVLLAVAAVGAGVAYLKNRDGAAGGPAAAPPGTATPPAQPTGEAIPVPVAPKPTTPPSASPGDRPDAGEFELVGDATVVNLSTGDLGDELYRVGTPKGSSVRPVADVDGSRVRLSLVKNGTKGAAAVNITLNAEVRWNLRVNGGIKTGVLDLSGTRLGAVDLRGGATRLDLVLPRPDGTLTVRMTGGINRFRIRTADRAPARVRAQRGAGKITLYDVVEDGVARGQSLASPAFDRSTDRIDVDAVAGMGTLIVDDA